MGLIDWFKRRKPSAVEADSVWLTAAARLAGLCDRAADHSRTGQVLLLAHFPRTLDEVADALRARVEVERARGEADVERALASPQPGSVCLALVRQLPTRPPAVFGQVRTPVSLLVAERHPLRAEDEKVERLAGELPYASRLRFHLSLEDPLLERFAGDRVTALLAQLGMSENDELSHPLIAGAVERAQEQLAGRAAAETEAESVEDFLRAIEPE